MKKTIFVFSLALASLTLSAQQNAGYTDKQSGYETNRFWNNWFLNVGGGPAFYWAGEHNEIDAFAKHITWGATLSAGKWFTPLWGGRLTVQGGKYHTFSRNGVTLLDEAPKHKVASDGYLSIHADGLFNFSNWVAGYKADRVYNLIPYIGVGIGANEWPWQDGADLDHCNRSFVPVVGLLNSFRLGKRVDFTVDISGQAVQSKWNSARFGQNSEVAYKQTGFDRQDWDGIVSVNFGFNFKLGKQGFNRGRVCVKDNTDSLLVDNLTKKVNALTAENNDLKNQLANQPISTTPVTETTKPARTSVSKIIAVPFDLNKFKVVSNKQKSIVDEAVAFLKNNPDTDVRVVGYADKKTGTKAINNELSRKRADEVTTKLINAGISKDRISTYWKGDDVQPYADNNQNRVVIITALDCVDCK